MGSPAFTAGYDTGFERGSQGRLLKQQRQQEMWESEQKQKATDLANQRLALQQKYSASLDENGKPTDATKGIEQEMQQNASDIREFYHPDKNPNAIERWGHILTDKLGITKPDATMTMVTPNPEGLVSPGNIDIWNRPTVENPDGSHSSEFSVSVGDDQGHEVLLPTIVNGRFLTPDGKIPKNYNDPNFLQTPEGKALTKAAWAYYKKTGENLGIFDNPQNADAYAQILHSRGTTPKNIIKQQRLASEDLAATRASEAGAPLSPEEQASLTAKSQTAGALTAVQEGQKAFIQLNPKSTSEEQQANLNLLMERYFGVQGRGHWVIVPGKINGQPISLQYDTNTDEWRTMGLSPVPPEMMASFVPDKKPLPLPKPSKGWKFDPASTEAVNLDTGQRYGIDDIGKPTTPIEAVKLLKDGQATMTKKQKDALSLALERGLAYGQGRFGAFVDPSNPTQVIAVPYGEAAKRGLHLATGAQYQTMEAMLKSSTSGPIANEVVAFSTALQHADLLQQAVESLDNGDQRILNAISNNLATEFGDPRPTNFNAIAGAYTREVTKALASGHVTDTELAVNGATLPLNASPEQLLGAITAYKKLMNSKINIRLDQIKAGMSGHPYTGGANTSNNNNSPAPKPGQSNSEYVYAQDPQGGIHKTKKGKDGKPSNPLPNGWKIINAPAQ